MAEALEHRAAAAGRRRRDGRRADHEVPRGRGADRSRRSSAACGRHADLPHRAHPHRLRAQEQGRPAHARRGRGLPAVAARRAADAGHRPRHGPGDDAQGLGRGALLGARLQDRRGPVRGQAGLLPGLLGHAQGGLVRAQPGQGQARAHRAHPPDARQPPRGDRPGLRGRHRRRGRPQGHLHGRHPVPPGAPRDPGVDDLPGAGHRGRHRAQDQGRPGQAGRRAPAPRGGGPDLPRQDGRGDRPDPHRGHGRAAPRRARGPHGRASSGSPPTWASRRWPIAPRSRKAAQGNGRFIRQTGGRGQYGHAIIKLEPNEKGAGYEFVDKIVGGTIPREYIKSVDAGIREALESGPYGSVPMVDVKATLFDGSFHEVDSSEMAFKIAGSMALKDAVEKADPDHPRADHEGRGDHARGVHGRRHRRPQLPPRADGGHGQPRTAPRSCGRSSRSPRCSATSPTCGA